MGPFDDLIRAEEHRLWNREAERLRGPEVDDQLELRGLLHGQFSWFCALQDLVDEDGRAPPDAANRRGVKQTAIATASPISRTGAS